MLCAEVLQCTPLSSTGWKGIPFAVSTAESVGSPCSVSEGEVFVLKNRMDDNWAWGTSQLSGNSGIIPLVIMEEVHGENNWYYGKVWFRPDVSKDRAIDLLKTSKFQGRDIFIFSAHSNQ